MINNSDKPVTWGKLALVGITVITGGVVYLTGLAADLTALQVRQSEVLKRLDKIDDQNRGDLKEISERLNDLKTSVTRLEAVIKNEKR